MEKQKRPRKAKSESGDMKLLKECLGQYYRARLRRKQLENRLQEIRQEMMNPISGVSYGAKKNRPTNQAGLGAANLVFRKSEYETRIEEQRKESEKALLLVMDIFDFLDMNSDERMVLELRYIDNREWNDISKEAHMSRSVCFCKKEAGLKKLLAFDGVKIILHRYQEAKQIQ
ncbi:MAG: hypothetical protein PHV18_04365 [Lachnospiraceae bacterium]|nr:hypothetical protein [Lachnospiraceae bacterium]